MLNAHVRRLRTSTIAIAILLFGSGSLIAQEGHEAEEPAAAHAEGEHQEHEFHVAHEKNEIAVFLGGTRRLKFEDDETGATAGLEYARQIRPRVAASLGFEFAAGEIERDWVAMLKLGIQPFEGWALPLILYIGTGIEVASVDEVLLEADEHGGVEEGEGHGGEATVASEEHGESGERETEVDALMRLGTGWIIHAGSFSIIPNVNFDLVGEDWAAVFGVTLGYRF
ncbi:MAG: hypothetical protein M8862_04440 [marine benthic group bacterium]|jgi:hypothetical protein|nr:hypothetical protein [Gemmatimonadota bacterium]